MTLSGPRVLIVEDALPTRVLMETALRLVGCTVESCGDGGVGLERAMADVPDVVVLDIALPTMSGWEVLERLRGHPSTARIPVVVATAHATVEHHERADGLGADAFVDKPFNPADLQRAVLAAAGKWSGP